MLRERTKKLNFRKEIWKQKKMIFVQKFYKSFQDGSNDFRSVPERFLGLSESSQSLRESPPALSPFSELQKSIFKFFQMSK